jgi:salicylate hydroxylase
VTARTIVIAGAGIGGLTAALALANKGFRIILVDKADRLDETGAGIQLSPNAARVLIGLGLRERLMPAAVAPEAIVIKTRRNRELARLPLGAAIAARYGAPYWIIHRGDLQAALLDAVRAHPDIALELSVEVDGFALNTDGITVQALRNLRAVDIQGAALVGADGVWSNLRARLAGPDSPRFAQRTAWRALVPADAVAPDLRGGDVHLWLGRRSHLVHYPVKAGAMINIVAIATDERPSPGWSTASAPDEVIARYSQSWAKEACGLLALPTQWLKWPLYWRPPLRRWGEGPVTLLGDAAHPMLPFLAQGAAMAIEDAAVLANFAAATPDDMTAAMRRYEDARRERTAKVERTARLNGRIYHLAWPASALRNLAMRALGSERLLARYDWIYGWRAE